MTLRLLERISLEFLLSLTLEEKRLQELEIKRDHGNILTWEIRKLEQSEINSLDIKERESHWENRRDKKISQWEVLLFLNNHNKMSKSKTKKPVSSSKPKSKEDVSFEHVTLLRHPILTFVTFTKVIYHFLITIPPFILWHYVLFTLVPLIMAGFHFLEGPHT